MNVGLLGAGHIARALAAGWRRQITPPRDRHGMFFYDIAPGQSSLAAAESGGVAVASVTELVERADVVILAVRPPEVAGVLAQLVAGKAARPVVSLAAGIRLESLRRGLSEGAAVGRIMPNVAAAVGAGVFLFAPGSLGSEEGQVRALFAAIGDVVEVDEALFDAATAISGCGPGFVALLLEGLESAGAAAGLEPAVARALATGAFAGTIALVEAGRSPRDVREAICSPGGMTAAGVAALEAAGVRAALDQAVKAAIARAAELA